MPSVLQDFTRLHCSLFPMYVVMQGYRPWFRCQACLSECAVFLQDELELESVATRGELERANDAEKSAGQQRLQVNMFAESLEETSAQLDLARHRIQVSLMPSHYHPLPVIGHLCLLAVIP